MLRLTQSDALSDSTAPPAVLTERRGHVLEITLNRPEKKNPFNPEMLVRLADIWDELDADDDLRVAIVTGAGENFFCPGWDLKAAAGGDAVDGDPEAVSIGDNSTIGLRTTIFTHLYWGGKRKNNFAKVVIEKNVYGDKYHKEL